uniref:Uncharacterized protein n=1 Tax=Candidatus Kentrum sp. FM TaxID=2126340 RepID=A0A450WV94_9GAMM|nr:MAG: hypothetical protein BECKFM1743A_GA0114220_106474 [Candidatus Kentron sp. FM]VFJ73280.1 MAG: hypothetical protein BECKFM1743C_GA0114222_107184 [Candidatus Kentron sp. FM]VFK20947.1 MAG: hypothetical protein BECKFM1743B_GA0114221_107453 [Candidatus Kentron sp. FM]
MTGASRLVTVIATQKLGKRDKPSWGVNQSAILYEGPLGGQNFKCYRFIWLQVLRFPWDRRVVLGIFWVWRIFAEYNSAIVRPRGRFISGVKVPDRSMP